jgi:integrase
MLKQIAKENNLQKPTEIKTWLADLQKCKWNNRTKTKFIDDYNSYLNFAKLKWIAPKYQITERLPFIPTETEIDQLIASCGKQISTVLQMLKETGMRIGEATKIKWIDINYEHKTVNITPEKGSNPRILPISDKLTGMINRLPKNRETLFQPQTKYLRTYFDEQRKTATEKLQNPRLKKITFHTLRHYKGTMEYHKTKDIMHVKYVLGHKNINSTIIYINIEQAIFLTETDEWTSKVSHNTEEEQKLIETGFQLVRSINETTAIYKKRK